MRTTISLPDPLLELAKQHASEKGKTLSEFVEDAVRLLVLQPTPSPAREPFQLLTVGGVPLDPTVNLDRTSEILLDQELDFYRPKQC